jgi:heterodisulfide reductase subunit B
MSSSYGYFPGCSLKGTGVAYEESLLTLFRLLDLPLAELEDWNCCGATSYMSIDERSAFMLSARNFSLAHKQHRRDLVAPCSACYLVLRKAQDYMERYPQTGREIAASMGNGDLRVLNSIRIRHPLEVLYTDIGPGRIREKIVRHWRGGPVACYYGCQMVRPYGEADRDYNPVRMDELLAAVGVPTVPYSLKTKCCGGSLTGTTHEVGVRLNYILLKEAARKGAQAIVTVCPLCQYNLDAYQSEMRHATGERLDMPVLYFTQILGWALGGEIASLGFRRAISGRKTIAQWFPKTPVARGAEKAAYA